jgi:hypothetical protein
LQKVLHIEPALDAGPSKRTPEADKAASLPWRQKPLQRAWRDAHAAAAHISLNWDAVATMYGPS